VSGAPEPMRKTFVLDTNVLLHEPRAFRRFADNDVVLPIYVVEELDSFKKDISGLGRNARAVSRELDELRARGRLSEGVPLDGDGMLRVVFARDVERAMSPVRTPASVRQPDPALLP
jgi:PhoH-like ATPase